MLEAIHFALEVGAEAPPGTAAMKEQSLLAVALGWRGQVDLIMTQLPCCGEA